MRQLLSILFIAVMIAPVIALFLDGQQLRWRTRYLIASIPVAYFAVGWSVSNFGFEFFGCSGYVTGPQQCGLAGLDVTWLMEFGGTLLIGAVAELPISLCLLSVLALSQLGAWRARVKQADTEKSGNSSASADLT